MREATPQELRETPVDPVVPQRPHELRLAEDRPGGRSPGRDVPAVHLEHNAPDGDVPETRHAFADRGDPTIVHVTRFNRNRLFWDCGSTRTEVIGHGIVDPGHRYTGRLDRAAVVVDEPLRRGRYTGTDLLPGLAAAVPLDVFGMRTAGLAEHLGLPPEQCRTADLPQHELHAAMAERRMYLHPVRWTSLGLSLLEAMHLGMPVLAPATTEAVEAVPDGSGTVSSRPDVLARAARRYRADAGAAAARGTGQAGRARTVRAQAVPGRLGTPGHGGVLMSPILGPLPVGRPARRRGPPPGVLSIPLVSEHASPLAALGGADAGGQNVAGQGPVGLRELGW